MTDDLEDKVDNSTLKELNFIDRNIINLAGYVNGAFNTDELWQENVFTPTNDKRTIAEYLGRGGVPKNISCGRHTGKTNKPIGKYIAYSPGIRIFTDGQNGYALDIDYTQQANQDHSSSFRKNLQDENANSNNRAILITLDDYWKNTRKHKVTPNKILEIKDDNLLGNVYSVPIYTNK